VGKHPPVGFWGFRCPPCLGVLTVTCWSSFRSLLCPPTPFLPTHRLLLWVTLFWDSAFVFFQKAVVTLLGRVLCQPASCTTALHCLCLVVGVDPPLLFSAAPNLPPKTQVLFALLSSPSLASLASSFGHRWAFFPNPLFVFVALVLRFVLTLVPGFFLLGVGDVPFPPPNQLFSFLILLKVFGFFLPPRCAKHLTSFFGASYFPQQGAFGPGVLCPFTLFESRVNVRAGRLRLFNHCFLQPPDF